MRALTPSAAHCILRNGEDILLLYRGDMCESWPKHWCIPGWKVEDDELFRTATVREVYEEVGVQVDTKNIHSELLIHARYAHGMRIYYFAVVDIWDWNVANIEDKVHNMYRWISITAILSGEYTDIIPMHILAIQGIFEWKSYIEYDGYISKNL
jgi:ADP-ribose pyrophosphatase YjhB (NUDIX family)